MRKQEEQGTSNMSKQHEKNSEYDQKNSEQDQKIKELEKKASLIGSLQEQFEEFRKAQLSKIE